MAIKTFWNFTGQRTRKPRKRESSSEEEKRPRTAFTADQLDRLKEEFRENKWVPKGGQPQRRGYRYLTEKRRQELAHELRLNESQIKIWFQVRLGFSGFPQKQGR